MILDCAWIDRINAKGGALAQLMDQATADPLMTNGTDDLDVTALSTCTANRKRCK